MILNDKKIIFLHVPKCAGKSVEVFFSGKTVADPHNRDWKLRNEIIEGKYTEFYKFGIIRNPIDRTISVYNYYNSGGNKGQSDLFIKRKLENVSANKFVENIENYRGNLLSHHMLGPQYNWFFNNEIKLVDDILLFDDLPENVINIGKNYNIDMEFPHINKRKKYAVRKDLSDKSLDKLFKYYKLDFKLIISLNKEK